MVCNETISYSLGGTSSVSSFIYTLSVLLSVLTIIGNLMVLLAVKTSQNLKTISNYFLCSLATADLWVGCFHTPFYTVLSVLDAPSEGLILNVDFFVWLHILFSSTLSLSLISVDRYIAVKWPFKYIGFVTNKVCVVLISMVWLTATCFAFPAIFIEDLKAWSGYIATCALCTMVIPLVIVTVCYIEIVKISRQQTTKVESINNKNNVQQIGNQLKNKKAVTTFAIVTAVFLVAYTPNFVFAMWFYFTQTCKEEYDVFQKWTVSLYVMFTSSSANPVIYGFRNKEFRDAFRKIIRYLFRCGNRVSSLPTNNRIPEFLQPAWDTKIKDGRRKTSFLKKDENIQ